MCAAHSVTYDAATLSYAGSGGSNANCVEVLVALNASDHAFDSGGCSQGFGCFLADTDGIHCTGPVTTEGAGAGGVVRACACE